MTNRQTALQRAAYQTTLAQRTALKGIGVHSGTEVSVALHPAEADSGIVFLCTNPDNGDEHEIRADYRHVVATDLCTAVGSGQVSVSTIEHLMAALRALEIDNVVIEVDGPEMPVMDGSSAPFVEAIEQGGVTRLRAPRRYIRVLETVHLRLGDSHAEFRPYDRFRLEVEIDFSTPVIGRQVFADDICSQTFRDELARARTFGFLTDVEQLCKRGFALGASLENAVVIGDDAVVNPEGLRFPDEFVRHKALDAVGDLALAGAPILGCYRSYRGGHKLNFEAVRTLLENEKAWEWVEAPVRREVGHADLHAGVGVAAYGPDAS